MNATLRTEAESPALAAANRVVADQDTARTALAYTRDKLAKAVAAETEAAAALRQLVITARPAGELTVDEIAAAVGRTRNYVDSEWSAHGTTVTGKQTRVATAEVTDARRAEVKAQLAAARKAVTDTGDVVKTARAERDRTVAMVYASKLLGPSAIAGVVEVDRNHVLRIARKAGVKPVHRAASRNQYTN